MMPTDSRIPNFLITLYIVPLPPLIPDDITDAMHFDLAEYKTSVDENAVVIMHSHKVNNIKYVFVRRFNIYVPFARWFH